MSTPLPISYFSGFTGEARNSQRRLARQSAAGVPATTGYQDILGNGGAIPLQLGSIPYDVIRGGRQKQRPLDGPLLCANAALEMGPLDPAQACQLMTIGQFMTAYDAASLGTGAYRYIFSAAGGTDYSLPHSLLDDTDISRARYHDVRWGDLDVSLASGQGNGFKAMAAFGKVDFHGDGTQITGTGDTVPLLRMTTLCGAYAPDSEDHDIELKVVSFVSGLATFLAKPTRGGTFGSTSFTANAGGPWAPALDSTTGGELGGNIIEQPEILIPAGATLTANSVFRYTKRRNRWTASFPVSRPLTSLGSLLLFGGVQLPVDNSVGIKIAAGKVERRQGTGRQPIGTQVYGEDQPTITVTRQIADMTLQAPLVTGERFPFVAAFRSNDKIAATQRNYAYHFVYPEVRVTGVTWGPAAGAGNRQETITLEPGIPTSPLTYDGVSVGTYCAIFADTDIASLP